MEDTTETRVPAVSSALLAGLQAGMLGALWMLAWLGVSAAWQNRGFWFSENLFSTAFYGSDAVRSDFSVKTLPGLALCLLLYSLLGAVFAVSLRSHPRSGRLTLFGILFALTWFYASFHGVFKSEMPLVYLLYSEHPMVVGHLIYGFCIGRFAAHYPGRASKPAPPIAAVEPEPFPSADQSPLSGPPVAP